MAKFLVSLPDETKYKLDQVAKQTHRSRSAVIREVIESQFGLRSPQTPPYVSEMIDEVRKSVGRHQGGKIIRHFRDTRGRY